MTWRYPNSSNGVFFVKGENFHESLCRSYEGKNDCIRHIVAHVFGNDG